MKNIRNSFLALIALFSLSFSYGQEVSTYEELSAVLDKDYGSFNLPPLETLYENALQSPGVQIYQERSQEEQRVMKSVKREWLNYFRLNGHYQYGRTNDYSTWVDPNMPMLDRYSDKSQSLYGVGASVGLPLFSIVDRRNKIKSQQFRIKSIEFEGERAADEIRLKIIDAYTNALQFIAVMKSTAESAHLAKTQYLFTQQEFINGKTDAQTLSRQKNIETESIRVYEEAKAALYNALLKLELLAKTKIINTTK